MNQWKSGVIKNGDNTNTAVEYGYKDGTIIDSSVYIKVAVTGSKLIVEFIKANAAKEVLYTYEINN